MTYVMPGDLLAVKDGGTSASCMTPLFRSVKPDHRSLDLVAHWANHPDTLLVIAVVPRKHSTEHLITVLTSQGYGLAWSSSLEHTTEAVP